MLYFAYTIQGIAWQSFWPYFSFTVMLLLTHSDTVSRIGSQLSRVDTAFKAVVEIKCNWDLLRRNVMSLPHGRPKVTYRVDSYMTEGQRNKSASALKMANP